MPATKRVTREWHDPESRTQWRFEGHVDPGDRYIGRGRLYFRDAEDEDPESGGCGGQQTEEDGACQSKLSLPASSDAWHLLEGRFVEGALEGPGIWRKPDNVVVHGTFLQGEMSGPGFQEYCEISGRTIYEGEYAGNERHGKGTVHLEDGAVLSGIFVEGHFASGYFQYPTSSIRAPYPPPCTHVLLRDPLEDERCYVAKSTICGAGDGLFAKCDLPEGSAVAYYYGTVLLLREAASRSWEENANLIALDDFLGIDVPKPFDSVRRYRCSLGHKANHRPLPALQNVEFRPAWHPRWHDCRCLVTTRDISRGEELFTDYRYAEDERPNWCPPEQNEPPSSATNTAL